MKSPVKILTTADAIAYSVEIAVAKALYAIEHKKVNAADFDQEAADHQKYWLESARAAIAAYKKATAVR